jgi:hypothetical protein
MSDLCDDVAILLDVLQRIARHTDPDDPTSYRADDREGCLETVHQIARDAVKEYKAKHPADGGAR